MRVSILGNPRITNKVHFLFWVYNWKWMNLSKMPGLNRRQNNSNKNVQLKLTSHSVFFPFPLFIDSEIYKTIHSNFRDAPQFPNRRNLGENLFSLNICEVTSKQRRCKPQAPIKGGNFGAKLTHLCDFLSNASFLSRVKNNRTRFWLDVSFFVYFCFCFFIFTCEKHRPLLWLARTHLHWKFTT